MGLFERIAAWFDDRPAPTRPSPGSEGVDINPATGLPTVAGVGSPDVAGNPYGMARSHEAEFNWQRHDRWDNHHHCDSWSAGSHDPWRY